MPSSRLPAVLRAWRLRASAWLRSERARRALAWGRRLLTAGIVAALVWQLSRVGWTEIVAALPANPLFYLLLLVTYLTLPAAESLIYRHLWGVAPREAFGPLMKKRVYNEDVLGYSGETYLFLWARRRLGRSDGDLLRSIRDVNIVSSASSFLFAAAVVAAMAASGQLPLGAWLGASRVQLLPVGLALVVLGVLAVVFRRYLFALPRRSALTVFGLHTGRLLVANALLVMQWKVGAPEIPLQTWLTLLCVVLVMNRIPLLPSRDLLIIGAGVGVAQAMHVAEASMAGMLLVNSAVVKLLNLGTLAAVRLSERRKAEPPLEEAAA